MDNFQHYGYCRVSTQTQDVSKQEFSLLQYAQSNNFQLSEIIKVVTSSRKDKSKREIDYLFSLMQHGDHLYITKLDRLGRNTREVLELIEELKLKQITIHILKDNIVIDPNKCDAITTMFLTLLSAFSQMERDFISERTKAGLERARAEGKLLGKKKGSISKNTQYEPFKDTIIEYLKLGLSYQKIVNLIGVGSKSSLYSYVQHRDLCS